MALNLQKAGVPLTVWDACHQLFRETVSMGLADEDMAAVVQAIEARSQE